VTLSLGTSQPYPASTAGTSQASRRSPVNRANPAYSPQAPNGTIKAASRKIAVRPSGTAYARHSSAAATTAYPDQRVACDHVVASQ
jgi:hypothetical protein